MAKLNLTIMGWNIENVGTSKYTSHGPELIKFVAKVMDTNAVALAGFSELRSGLGKKISDDIAKELNTMQSVTTWKAQASPKFGKNRWEEYAIVWDSAKLSTYNGNAATTPNSAFQTAFVDPASASKPKLLGFPRQSKLDRPPFAGYFQASDSNNVQRKFVFAIMHSPGPGYFPNVRDAARNMAQVAEFKKAGESCVIMGDFNVKSSTDQSVTNSYGDLAFSNLVTANLRQVIEPIDVETSLIKATILTSWDDKAYLNQPYDQVFLRWDNVTPTLTDDAYQDDLIEECVTSGWSSTATGYLEPFLGAITDAYSGNTHGTTKYAKTTTGINNAFIAFRRRVSDHMPVFAIVKEP